MQQKEGAEENIFDDLASVMGLNPAKLVEIYNLVGPSIEAGRNVRGSTDGQPAKSLPEEPDFAGQRNGDDQDYICDFAESTPVLTQQQSMADDLQVS